MKSALPFVSLLLISCGPKEDSGATSMGCAPEGAAYSLQETSGATLPEGWLEPGAYYPDGDGDGFGDATAASAQCPPAPAWSLEATDCDDGNPSAWPGAPELCGGTDEDCDGAVDEDPADPATWYSDTDGDGHGNADLSLLACTAPVGFVADGTDCDDADATRSPSLAEVCDGVDNDCDRLIDDDIDCSCSAVGLLASFPLDGDGREVAGGADATVTGTTATADRAGTAGGALLFDGVDDWVQTQVEGSTFPLTVSAWFRSDDITGEHSLVDSDTSGAWGHSLIQGYWAADGLLDVQIHDGHMDTSFAPEQGRWHHAVVSWGAYVRLWIDGDLVLEAAYTPSNLDGASFRLGRHNSGDPQWFTGAMDEVTFWSCELEPDEVDALFSED